MVSSNVLQSGLFPVGFIPQKAWFILFIVTVSSTMTTISAIKSMEMGHSSSSTTKAKIPAVSLTSYGGDKAYLNTLKFVQVIMRHGARNPVRDYPTNPYTDLEKDWPGGYGQLTHEGEEQTCELGAYLRGRYGGFLPAQYHMDDMLAWSSFTERSIRSANAALRGLYPRITAQSQHSNRSLSETSSAKDSEDCLRRESQIVPIRTVAKKDDNFIYYSQKCDADIAEHNRYMAESEEFKEMETNGEWVFSKIRKETGAPLPTNGRLDTIAGLIIDSLFIQKFQNKTLPSWFTPEMEAFAYTWLVQKLQDETATPLLRRLRSGIVEKVVSNMEEFVVESDGDYLAGSVQSTDEFVVKGKGQQRSLVLFSGHDRTIITFLNILGAFNKLRPPFASAVLVELHQNSESKEYYVQIFYRNDTLKKAYPVEIPECTNGTGGPCYLNRLKEITKLIFPKDLNAECQLGLGDKLSPSSDVTKSQGVVVSGSVSTLRSHGSQLPFIISLAFQMMVITTLRFSSSSFFTDFL